MIIAIKSQDEHYPYPRHSLDTHIVPESSFMVKAFYKLVFFVYWTVSELHYIWTLSLVLMYDLILGAKWSIIFFYDDTTVLKRQCLFPCVHTFEVCSW